MHRWEEFNGIKTLNCLYFQFSLLPHSIIVFIPVGISLLLQYLLQVLLGLKVCTVARFWYYQIRNLYTQQYQQKM
jgi:hypothetical protein